MGVGRSRRRLGPGGRLAIQLAATVLVTWLILDRLGVGLDQAVRLGAGVADVRPLSLVGSVALLLAGFAISALLWARMVGELGGPAPGALAANRIVFTSNLARYLPGKIWQIAGLAILSKRAGIPGSVASAAGVLGQTFSLSAAAVLALPALVGIGEEERLWAFAVITVLGVAVVLTSVPSLFRGSLRALYRLAGLPPGEVPVTGILFGPRWLLSYVSNWVVYAAAFVLFVWGLGWTGAAPILASAFAAAYLMGYVAFFAPAGIGIREGLLIALLRPIVGEPAVALAVLARVWMTCVELVPAGGFALWEVLRPPVPSGSNPSTGARAGEGR